MSIRRTQISIFSSSSSWAIFKNFEDINFRGLPNFKHFGEMNFRGWPLFNILKKNEENNLCGRGKGHWFLFCFPFFVIDSFQQNLKELILNCPFASSSYSQRHSFELLLLYFSKDMHEKSYNIKINCHCLIPIYDTWISKTLTYMMNNYKIWENL